MTGWYASQGLIQTLCTGYNVSFIYAWYISCVLCMQCCAFPCCSHVLHHMVVYSICWWVFQPTLCKTGVWHIR